MRASFLDQIPIRIGTPEEFDRVAKTLSHAHFDEETLCRTLKLNDMADVGRISEIDNDSPGISPQLNIIIRLFLCLSLVARSEVESVFDKATIESFLSLGLVGTGEFGQDDYYATVLFYPVADFWIASDRLTLPGCSGYEAPPDTVFPAIYTGTLQFLRLVPRGAGSDALDLCAGTGIAALVLGRSHTGAVAVDITERATQFALFNCALNKCTNVEVMCGDLYEAVEGRKFDRIVAHPPYVPSVGLNTIWRDGGATGEFLVRKIIEGLPEHLRNGGMFACLTQGLDTRDGKFEERVRGWLKESADEFDVVFVCELERTTKQVLDLLSNRGTLLLADLKEVQAELEREKTVSLPYGALFIRRDASASRKPWTVRKKLSDVTEGSDLEATFLLHDQLSDSSFAVGLVEATPRLAPRLEVKVTYVVDEGALAPAQYLFETDKPFSLRVKFDEWMVPLLTGFDGKSKVADVYEKARSEGEIPGEFRLEDFAVLVSRAIEGGFLQLTAEVAGSAEAGQSTSSGS
jgi:SAM-dependent methyltransferase